MFEVKLCDKCIDRLDKVTSVVVLTAPPFPGTCFLCKADVDVVRVQLDEMYRKWCVEQWFNPGNVFKERAEAAGLCTESPAQPLGGIPWQSPYPIWRTSFWAHIWCESKHAPVRQPWYRRLWTWILRR